jgi:hypothetical protein
VDFLEQLDIENPSEQTGGADTKGDKRQTNRESLAADPLSMFVEIHQRRNSTTETLPQKGTKASQRSSCSGDENHLRRKVHLIVRKEFFDFMLYFTCDLRLLAG